MNYTDLIQGKERISVIGLGYVGLPIALEFARRVPVIGFDVGSTREIIAHGETGLVVPDADAEGLAAAMAALAEDEALRRRMGDEARKRALRDFTGWEERVGREIEIIEALIRKRRESAPR